MAYYRGGHLPHLTLGLGALGGVVLTKSDTIDETHIFRCVYVGGTGDVNVVTTDGSLLLFSAAPAGSIIPIHGKRIQSTGTTATLMVGIW